MYIYVNVICDIFIQVCTLVKNVIFIYKYVFFFPVHHSMIIPENGKNKNLLFHELYIMSSLLLFQTGSIFTNYNNLKRKAKITIFISIIHYQKG